MVNRNLTHEYLERPRLSVYDIMVKNLERAGRRTFLHRYTYFGRYVQKPQHIEIQDLITNIVSAINSDYCLEKLTGFIAFSKTHFVVFIEGSEDSIVKHLIRLFKEGDEIIGESRILITEYHIARRFFDVWDCKSINPPTLISKIKSTNDEEFRHIKKHVLQDLFNAALQLRVVTPDQPTLVGEVTSQINLLMPGADVLEYLIMAKFPSRLRRIISTFNKIPKMFQYTERTWPVRNDFVPFDIFDKEENPIPYLPGFEGKKYV